MRLLRRPRWREKSNVLAGTRDAHSTKRIFDRLLRFPAASGTLDVRSLATSPFARRRNDGWKGQLSVVAWRTDAHPVVACSGVSRVGTGKKLGIK